MYDGQRQWPFAKEGARNEGKVFNASEGTLISSSGSDSDWRMTPRPGKSYTNTALLTAKMDARSREYWRWEVWTH